MNGEMDGWRDRRPTQTKPNQRWQIKMGKPPDRYIALYVVLAEHMVYKVSAPPHPHTQLETIGEQEIGGPLWQPDSGQMRVYSAQLIADDKILPRRRVPL